jgi:hypothetical protein
MDGQIQHFVEFGADFCLTMLVSSNNVSISGIGDDDDGTEAGLLMLLRW